MPKGSKLLEAVAKLNNGESLSQEAKDALILAGISDVLDDQEKIIKKLGKVQVTQQKIMLQKVAMCKDIEDNTREVATLRKRSDISDGILGFLAVLGAAIGSLLGK